MMPTKKALCLALALFSNLSAASNPNGTSVSLSKTKSVTNATIDRMNETLSYDESFTLTQVHLAEASYCVSAPSAWTCKTCDANIQVTAVVESNGGRTLVGFNGNTKALFVSYRGTSNPSNWWYNIQIVKKYPYPEYPSAAVEDGFNKLYGYLQEAGVAAALSDAAAKFSTGQVDVTGHSLGASLATLLAVDIARGVVASAGPELSLRTVTTFGSPRVGDTNFAAFHSQLGVTPKNTRVTHYYDVVPHIPEEALGFHHVSTEVWYDEPSTSYKVCDGSGEDDSCSNSCGPTHCTSVDDHLLYLNVVLGENGC
mmetsp:Transcript_31046/g.62099  ORF Transcript_31046/g.62099 Transcript_31046/m.62099 type:complete len:312 (+) Transcript_31046:16-951(+)